MAQSQDLVEQLIARARAGEEAARGELFDHLTPELRQAAAREKKMLQDGGSQDGRSTDQLLRATFREAARRFQEFQGTSQAEVCSWLSDILLGICRATSSGMDNPGNFETVPPGTTMKSDRSPAQAEPPPKAVNPGVETLVDSGADPNATIAPGSLSAKTLSDSVGNPKAPPPPVETPGDPNGTIAPGSPAAKTLADSVAGATPPPPNDIHAAETMAAAGGRDPTATLPPDANATIAGSTSRRATPPPIKTFGEYEILGVIAQGGMGIVYKARQPKLNRVVALKMILAGQFADQSDVERFYVEAEASANLRHPNIVGVYEVGECEGQHYFSMDYIEGQSLGDLVREQALPSRRAAQYVKTISEAMHYAHQEGILHRDLKPSNVLVDRKNVPLVTDFGLAKRAEGQSQLTMSGTIVGTPAYMPPEQASGKLDEISAASDVYSLGAILYELLTTRPPFVAANPFETIKQVLENEPVSPRLLNQTIPVDLDTICLKCLQKEPDRRYTTAQELVDELERYLAGEPILARPVGPAERAWRWCRRNPKVATSLAVTTLTVLTALIVFPILYVRAEASRREAVASIDQMRIAIDELYTDVSNEGLLNEPALKPFRQNLLRKARDLYGKALDRLGRDDPRIQEDLAVSHFLLGRILLELEEPGESLEPLETAGEIQLRLLKDQPNDIDRVHALANTLNFKGQVLENLGRLDEALQVYDKAVLLRQKLVDIEEPEIKKQLQARPDDLVEYRRQLVNSQMNIGLIHRKMMQKTSVQEAQQDHYDQALKWLGDAQAGRYKLLEGAPKDPKLHLDLAKGSYNLAVLTFTPVAKRAEEIGTLERQLEELQWELEDYPPDADPQGKEGLQREVAASVTRITDMKAQIVPLTEVVQQHLSVAFSRLADLLADDADERFDDFELLVLAEIKYMHAGCLQLAGNTNNAKQDIQQAEASYEQARSILEQLVEEDSATHQYRAALAGAYNLIGDLKYAAREDEAAKACYAKALQTYIDLVADFSSMPEYRATLGATYLRNGDLNFDVDYAQAKTFYGEAIATFEQLVSHFPNASRYKQKLATAEAALQELEEMAAEQLSESGEGEVGEDSSAETQTEIGETTLPVEATPIQEPASL